MFSWLLALLLALTLWGLTSAWLWLVKRRNTENQHGLAALAGMRWREFSQIVHRAMSEQRNLHELVNDEESADRRTSSDFLMEGKERWLISCKHGRAYRLGAASITEMATAQQLTGAGRGVLITEGRVERDGLAAAQKHGIEVLDERNLWRALAPFVPDDTRQAVVGVARREAMRQTGIAALGALTVGLLAGLGYQTTLHGDDAPPARAAGAAAIAPDKPPAAAAPVAAGTEAATPAPAVDDTAMAAEDLVQNPDAATLLRYQQAVSKKLAGTPGVISGIWLTRSTLSIERSADDATVWPLICREVERYPALRTTRIQLNPRPGTDEPVRWRQCSTI
ncbi:membrane protein [Stenotrophomonas daejeonensis]|uniref:Membrane protein n=1 Tax=Stenotrophomonas daejeonensis TaxID=659018 RepID=A0A0R0E8X1_9GAMM|nr:restriction endonuclease [Stenotrophomonas daejeonensis]KRG86596.1 membrane protein [Stenotrophomonas daejeonensis]